MLQKQMPPRIRVQDLWRVSPEYLEQAQDDATLLAISIPVRRVVGKIQRVRPVQVWDVQFLRANTDRRIKIAVPGPFTMLRQVQDDFYRDEQARQYGVTALNRAREGAKGTTAVHRLLRLCGAGGRTPRQVFVSA